MVIIFYFGSQQQPIHFDDLTFVSIRKLSFWQQSRY